MKPVIHRVAWNDELLLVKCKLCIWRSLDETMPTTKLSHPMTSCDLANSWKLCGRLRANEHSTHVNEPRPQRYLRRRDCRSGCVFWSPSHYSTPCMDCVNAATRPILGQWAIWVHVFPQSWQLGHNGLLPSWCTKNFIVPAISRTFFAAHIWKSRGKSWSIWWTDT